mgnify:CR=1 FL=1
MSIDKTFLKLFTKATEKAAIGAYKFIGKKDKILVSNGKSLVIKTKVSYYRYPLSKTPLYLILDKIW